MDKVAVLIALGGNDLEIPCRILPNIEKGKKICDEIFDMAGQPDMENPNIFYYRKDLEGECEGHKEISNTLFTHHYYGCGGPSSFMLKEVDFNSKFVGFDLDWGN